MGSDSSTAVIVTSNFNTRFLTIDTTFSGRGPRRLASHDGVGRLTVPDGPLVRLRTWTPDDLQPPVCLDDTPSFTGYTAPSYKNAKSREPTQQPPNPHDTKQSTSCLHRNGLSQNDLYQNDYELPLDCLYGTSSVTSGHLDE